MTDFCPQLPPKGTYAAWMQQTAEPELAACRTELILRAGDGTPLRCRFYPRGNSRAAVLICHGFTESCEKYTELIWHLRQMDYSVAVYDQRGHGASGRAVQPLWLTHVNRFSDYSDDLQTVAAETARRFAGQPLLLFAHSMGGAVGALVLERQPELFCGAVLSSPMIAPVTGGVPLPAVRLLCSAECLLGRSKKKTFVSGPFDPEEPWEKSASSDPERFAYYRNKRCADPQLQNSAQTYGWLFEAVSVQHSILAPEALGRICVPVLLFSAGEDSFVLPGPQQEFCRRVSSAELIPVAHSRHEIFNAENDVLRGYLQNIAAFYTRCLSNSL